MTISVVFVFSTLTLYMSDYICRMDNVVVLDSVPAEEIKIMEFERHCWWSI